MTGYTVIDLETTGLFPHRHDRVVEVAVVQVSDDGVVEHAWSSLVNPGRDVGPTHIHGISAREVLAAPTFEQLAPVLLGDLSNRTLVAHNLRFDLLFLYYELTRAGIDLPMPPVDGLCTMEWSGRHLRTSSRRLGDCCDAAGIELGQAHAAAHDAAAAAGLLSHFIALTRPRPHWHDQLSATRAYRWPRSPEPWPECSLAARQAVTTRRPGAWLDRITAGMPRHDDARVESYLEILESALLDRYLSEYEEQALAQMAGLLGLDSTSLADIHRDYLAGLAAVALADGVVTADERDDLERVAGLLGLGDDDVDRALEAALVSPAPSGFRLAPGDQVCFTGQMSRPRESVEADAAAHGLRVGGLTRGTRLLVAADPDSQSGKAAKARRYGVPVVTEQGFAGLLSQARR